ncbi:hypothetical protein LSAT2_021874 [Lamellibrachia satsuma]|nr:hypothetical protein LSAT2_021874 [Lamellibrachia satsuma]
MITRLPEVTREGTARLWVSCRQESPSGGTPTTPRCLTRASGFTDRCCGCRRHCLVRVSGDSKRERDDRNQPIGRCHQQRNVDADTHEFVDGEHQLPSSPPIEAKTWR